ncbi:depupylase/deamidase Dop [Pengzhenrongella frigida]|uniref:Proteasome accessory factor PafA2 n=1 Tax=Pengzhenrongella frigida TaxID=1259133 RepID=A0A4Q5N3F1_9MICO|nr:depupylase/deamidase Dop [Cellulomonas sp. HLT2-17]RYV52676.1 proteasome accessory factor PafA2 [Cellulomonas sp. HLT2-17]
MTVRRVMGIETEYGILQPGRPTANPMLLSSYVVAAHVPALEGSRTRAKWDYDDEDPLHDARGFRLQRASAQPSMLTDDPTRLAPSGDVGPAGSAGSAGPAGSAGSARTAGVAAVPEKLQELARPIVDEYDDPGAANVILTNGARLYVDHAHPEYSSPEVTGPMDGVRWDRAGEIVMLASVRALAQNPGLPDVALYKNNVDGKGATYGTHENYLVDRAVPFADLARRLIPFFVTRQVFTGAGRVGLGQRGETAGFQLSQRADYIEAEIGLETTLRRPIVNTRDEPHADPERWRRLHVIIGDANLLQTATYLKLGTTSLVLWLLEQSVATAAPRAAATALAAIDRLTLRDPVGAVHAVSHDLTLTTRLDLADGRRLTALEVQREYLAAVRLVLGDVPDAETGDVLDRWDSLLERLGTDPASCAREVEWLAKLRLLEGLRRRDHLAWDHPRLAAVDLQWSDVRPERGLYHRLLEAGAVERLIEEGSAERAAVRPPADTRAYFRGEALARYAGHISAASWDSIVFDIPGAPTLQRVPMRDPLRGTRDHVGALLDRSPDARSLLAALAEP